MNDFNISKKAIEHADSCRFCWMCHHVCPVGNATGLERNTARARGLAVSMVARGGAELTPDIIDNIYECTLCGGCTNVCVTGWDPVLFSKQTRNFAAMNGKLPSYIEKMLDNFDACGNIYGVKAIDKNLKKAIDEANDDKTLLFLGADARYKMPECAIDAINVLKKAGVKFDVLENEPDSGWAFDTIIGAAAETEQLMKDCANVINKYETVITFDPQDAKIFTREYKEYGVELKCETVTFTAFASKLIKDGAIKCNKSAEKLSFQDPAVLAREVGEVDEPRTIVSACAELCDMLNCKKDTMFAGNLLMNEYIPQVMTEMAKKRWDDVASCGADGIVTASPSEYALLKAVCPENKVIYTVEQLLLK